MRPLEVKAMARCTARKSCHFYCFAKTVTNLLSLFPAVMSTLGMRQVLPDRAQSRASQKRSILRERTWSSLSIATPKMCHNNQRGENDDEMEKRRNKNPYAKMLSLVPDSLASVDSIVREKAIFTNSCQPRVTLA